MKIKEGSWQRFDLIKSNSIASALNVSLPIIIAYSTSAQAVAVWFFCRTVVQLCIAMIPNPACAFFYSESRAFFNRGVLQAWGLVSVFCSILIALIIVYFKFFLNFSYFLFLPIYIIFFGLGCFSIIIARGDKRSDILLKAATIDFFGFFVSVTILFVSRDFGYFVLSQVLKEIARTIYIFAKLESRLNIRILSNRIGQSSFNFIKKWSMRHSYRSSIQICIQHGDRILLPIIFGLLISGDFAIGSSFAMIFGLLSSTAYTWALPFVAAGDDNKGQWLVKQWIKLQIIISTITLVGFYISENLAFNMLLDVDLSRVIGGFMFSASSAISFLAFGFDSRRISSNIYPAFHLLMAGAAYSVSTILYLYFDINELISVLVGSACFVFSVLMANFNFVKRVIFCERL